MRINETSTGTRSSGGSLWTATAGLHRGVSRNRNGEERVLGPRNFNTAEIGTVEPISRAWGPSTGEVSLPPKRQPMGDARLLLRNLSASELDALVEDWDSPLGEGGFGQVYRGRYQGMQVAVKILSPPSGTSLAGDGEYFSEAGFLAASRHRHIVTAYARSDERRAVVMELMDGGSLEDRLQMDTISWPVRVHSLHQAALGLAFLHTGMPSASLLHCDIKPSNILLTGPELLAKLADVGLANTLPSGRTRLSTASTLAGTPSYMDPEYLATGQFTAASDVYSFGLTILRTVTFRPVTGLMQEMLELQMRGGTLYSLLDDRPGNGEWDDTAAKTLLDLGAACCKRRPSERPPLDVVVAVLAELAGWIGPHGPPQSWEPLLGDEVAGAITANDDEKDARCDRPNSGDQARARVQQQQHPDASDRTESGLCVICLDAPASHLFIPCGHRCVCDLHAAVIAEGLGQRCPICRATAEGVQRVFL